MLSDKEVMISRELIKASMPKYVAMQLVMERESERSAKASIYKEKVFVVYFSSDKNLYQRKRIVDSFEEASIVFVTFDGIEQQDPKKMMVLISELLHLVEHICSK